MIRGGKQVEQLTGVPIRFLCRRGASEETGQFERSTHEGASRQHRLQGENLPACNHEFHLVNRPAGATKRPRVEVGIYHNATTEPVALFRSR